MHPTSIHMFDQQLTVLQKLLERHIPLTGWCQKSLYNAAIDAGFNPAEAFSVFDSRIELALNFLFNWINGEMENHLNPLDLTSKRIPERVEQAIQTRLHILRPYKSAMRVTLRYLASPLRLNLSARYLFQAVDTIWYAALDQSTDFNFYTKRALLAAVYTSTLNHWLRQPLDDLSLTFSHLHKRLQNVGQITHVKRQIKQWIA